MAQTKETKNIKKTGFNANQIPLTSLNSMTLSQNKRSEISQQGHRPLDTQRPPSIRGFL
mgnify:CR=1 FL=1